eukprot:gb/GEZN01004187.1/.p1 GENE.gb/GEZN01004187.1/~~gb/GEZN01004187.1/.p1  ORF type:complete len:517 (-),score=59.01 gb/GEZN01004187.1/:458-1819(-)
MSSCEDSCNCCFCHKDLDRIQMCGACGAMRYCSRDCQKADWSTGRPPMPAHKSMCKLFKRFAARSASLSDTFPWLITNAHGIFDETGYLAYRDLLVSSHLGYWSKDPQTVLGIRHKEQTGSAKLDDQPQAPMFNLLKTKLREQGLWDDAEFVNGHALLETSLMSEEEAWRLPREEIPSFKRLPPAAPEKYLCSWREYYIYRKLPLSSPACLLLQYPLTLYYIMSKLGLLRKKGTVLVHYIGAEHELNFLPVFQELAVLCPHIDLVIQMVGPDVAELFTQSGASTPCLLTVAQASGKPGEVLDFQAFGRVRVQLVRAAEYTSWAAQQDSVGNVKPDLVFAPNAGLLVYSTWQSVVCSCLCFRIPAVFSDYGESSLELIRHSDNASSSSYLQSMLAQVKQKIVAQGQDEKLIDWGCMSRPIALNPFRSPSNNSGIYRIPNQSNCLLLSLNCDVSV